MSVGVLLWLFVELFHFSSGGNMVKWTALVRFPISVFVHTFWSIAVERADRNLKIRRKKFKYLYS